MPQTDDYDWYDIAHTDQMMADEKFDKIKFQTLEYAKGLEDTARMDGGGDNEKMTFDAADDPALFTEDTDLKFTSLQQPPVPFDSRPVEENPTLNSVTGFGYNNGKTDGERSDRPTSRENFAFTQGRRLAAKSQGVTTNPDDVDFALRAQIVIAILVILFICVVAYVLYSASKK